MPEKLRSAKTWVNSSGQKIVKSVTRLENIVNFLQESLKPNNWILDMNASSVKYNLLETNKLLKWSQIKRRMSYWFMIIICKD